MNCPRRAGTALRERRCFSETNEMLARITLVERCRQLGVLPVWHAPGKMTFLKAPADFDWQALTSKLIIDGAGRRPDLLDVALTDPPEQRRDLFRRALEHQSSPLDPPPPVKP